MKRGCACWVLVATLFGCGASTTPISDASIDRPTPSDAAMDARADAAVLGCANNSECPPTMLCQFEAGCGETRGVCTDRSCLALPVASQFCSCDGRTLQAGACRPDQPFRSMGACSDGGADASADSSTRFGCGASQCESSSQLCESPRGPGACPRFDGGPCPPGCPGCPSLPPPTCAPIPAECAANPTCECVSRALCGSPAGARCEGNSSTGISVACLSA
jgi:hypothetical protein